MNKKASEEETSFTLKADLLVDLSRCVEDSRNIREFLSSTRSVLVRSGLPVFSLSLVTNENGNDYLNINADLCRLDIENAFMEDDDSLELTVNRKINLGMGSDYHSTVTAPVLDGIVVKTPGLLFEDEGIKTRDLESGVFFSHYFSLSPIVRKLYSAKARSHESAGNIAVFPVISSGAVRGTVDLLYDESSGRLDGYETRQLSLISRAIGTGFSNFLNIYRASSSDTKFRVLFESTRSGIFVINRDMRIVEANRQFKAWYPDFSEKACSRCYSVIHGKDESTPCRDCIAEQAFRNGTVASTEIKVKRNGEVRYNRIRMSPITEDNGVISSVMVIMEDITEKHIEDRKVRKQNRRLESEVVRTISVLKEKERNLATLVNIVHGIENSGSEDERFDRIIRGFLELKATSAALAVLKDDRVKIENIYPVETRNRIAPFRAGRKDRDGLIMKVEEDNPFVLSIGMVQPVFYIGEEGVNEFFRLCFPGSMENDLQGITGFFSGQSIAILPLETKNGAEGAIAVSTERDVLENNFEYFQLLSNTAAVEISRQKGADKIRRSEQKYRTLVEGSRDMIMLCDGCGKIRFSNTSFNSRTGISQNDISDFTIYDFFRNGSRDLLEKSIRASLENTGDPDPVELQMFCPDKSDIWTEMSVNNVTNGHTALQVVLRDISARKKMESEIGNLTALQEQILQNDFIGIITLDQDGIITNWNRGAHNLLGYEEREVLNRNIRELIYAENRDFISEFMKREIKSTPQIGRELQLIKKDGKPVSVMYIESVVKNGTDDISTVIAFFFDITDKVKYEKESKDLIRQLNQAQLVTILSLARLTEYRDHDTGTHLERIMRYTELIAHELSQFSEYKNYISSEYITDLVNSCPLHDIGKVGIPDQILHKPGKLTREEFEIMKNHTTIGGNTILEAEQKIRGRSYLNLGKEVAFFHHEKWDGSGYPKGLKGDEIPLSARIVAIADVYDALTSKRPYKEAFSHEKARKIILDSTNSHFDESIIRAFLNREEDFIQYRKECCTQAGNTTH